MSAIFDAVVKRPGIRKLAHRVEKNRTAFLAACLAIRPNVRKTFYNFVFRRKKMAQPLMDRAILPRCLYVEGTNICNAACVFCGYPQMKRKKTTMPMELFQSVVEQYVELGGRSVGFTPIVGDPFADRLLFERIDLLDANPKITNLSFYTNGIALRENYVDRLLAYENIDINLSVSFGGFDKETFRKVMGVDKFEVFKKNLEALLTKVEAAEKTRLSVKLDFRCPEKKLQNDPFYLRVLDMIRKKKVRSDTIGGVCDSFGGLISDEKLQEAGLKLNMSFPKMGPCGILFRKPIVLADGRVNACAERDLEASLIIGDLNQESLAEVLLGERRKKLINSYYQYETTPQVCKDCTIYESIFNPKGKVWTNTLNWSESPQEKTL